ncbi:hypothetical protein V8F06_012707 [Rhypophila decipiens]
MGMFDAANPDDRKKRNQRKDGSVVEKMKKSSEQVHPPAQLDDLVGRQDQLEAASLRRWFGLEFSSEAEQIAAEAKHIYRTPSVNGSELFVSGQDEDEDEINAYLRKEKKRGSGAACQQPTASCASRSPPYQAAPLPRYFPQQEQGRLGGVSGLMSVTKLEVFSSSKGKVEDLPSIIKEGINAVKKFKPYLCTASTKI